MSVAAARKKSAEPHREKPSTRRTRKAKNALVGWTFILPNFIGFSILTLVPVLVLGFR